MGGNMEPIHLLMHVIGGIHVNVIGMNGWTPAFSCFLLPRLLLLTHFTQASFYYRPRSEGDSVLGSIRLSVRRSVSTMSNNHHYQSKVIICVSVISGRLRIIMRMRSIGF